ncbi:hypothetical protein [Sutcliffiella rhizosphaerae]|nr:hypothetical protein [Sutcliffiella rhizosphaerae]
MEPMAKKAGMSPEEYYAQYLQITMEMSAYIKYSESQMTITKNTIS